MIYCEDKTDHVSYGGASTDISVDTSVDIRPSIGRHSIKYSSPADNWNNCAFDDKRMKLGTHVKHIQRSIFSYRAISDWSRDPYGGSF